MRASLLRILCLLGALSSATYAGASDLEDWLVRMTDATRTRNYTGTVMYRNGEMMETMRLIHRFVDGEVRERIFSTSGEAREILRKDDEVTCIIPQERKVTIDKFGGDGLFPELQRNSLERIKHHYALRDLGTTRVAGRQCRGIAIEPRDPFRYGYRIWMDTETAVPVKMSLVGPQDQVLEEVVFTDIRFPAAIDDAELAPELDYEGFEFFTHRMMPVETGGESMWAIGRLPPGFERVQRQVRRLRGSDDTVEYQMLSDGLSSVSIYSTVLPDGEVFTGPASVGAVSTYARLIGQHHVTVVGEVPPETVRMIADSLAYAR